MRKILARSFVLAIALFAVVVGINSATAAAAPAPAPPSAQAIAPVCDPGDICLWWNRNFEANSATAGFFFNEWDHLIYFFPANGQGGGSRVGNNSASFWNADGGIPVTVYYNPSSNGSRPSGPSQFYSPNQSRNCAQAGPNICNNNRAHFWG